MIKRENHPKFSQVVAKHTIRENGYNLNIPRYVDSSAATEHWDLHATMLGGIPNREIENLKDYWQALPQLHSALFKPKSSAYSELATSKEDVNVTIRQHPQVASFINAYNQVFNGFDKHLNTELIHNWQSVYSHDRERSFALP